MDIVPILIASSLVLPAVGLVSWAWLCMAQVETDLREFNAFGGHWVLHGLAR
ncbi:hypothetical protein PEC18_23775 [Paucibacter sp. O1-1]|uniref:hypothetical protein n=1 Tax=Paucibacter sp. M5-1 TaxID=3015998 RepID=UPI0021D49DD1|nr:hypothetical protein [Paucibacter sp. M5-1]MCU7373763.1 hypothetical protein [Paucibacter sp. O1-1]MCZ7880057.1 hypothetical protein [Paucibacter sp. M5-1]MDA3828765.1 hypothetical protein [Paucibacter sp. O1-1]